MVGGGGGLSGWLVVFRGVHDCYSMQARKRYCCDDRNIEQRVGVEVLRFRCTRSRFGGQQNDREQ